MKFRPLLLLSILAVFFSITGASAKYREEIVAREIHFALDRAVLTSEAKSILDEVFGVLESNSSTSITMVGHTCDLADNPYNEALARRRVDAAMAYLAAKGISPERLNIGSRGEEEPKYDNNDPKLKELNRRVEIRMITRIEIPAPTVSITADPSRIERGQSTRLKWTSADARSVSISPSIGSVSPAGSREVAPLANTSYIATAIGDGGEAQDEAVVEVYEPAPPPPPADELREVKAKIVDDRGNFITDLKAGNFSVSEDGTKREIVSVTYEMEGAKAAIGLVLDKSASLGSAIRDLRQAAITFVEQKKPEDEILVIAFSSDVVTLKNFETDRDQITMPIRKLQSTGSTKLYDALYAASEKMEGVQGPRYIVLMTDGVDEGGFGSRGSVHTLDEALKKVKSSGVSVYTVGLGQKLDRPMLEAIAVETNGSSYFTTDPAELKAIYEKLSIGLLRGQYKIVYKAPAGSNKNPVVGSATGRIVGQN